LNGKVDADLDKMIEKEPEYPEDDLTVNSIKHKVTEWNQHQQKINTPRTKN